MPSAGATKGQVTGQSFNPWALDRVPGGSSGGSAAALAAEMCLGALGTDTGGSVRGPAATCGVVGLRPTHGRIPLGGITPVSLQNDTVGPMARRVADVARMFAALTGYDRTDSTSADRVLENFLPTLGRGVEGVRIAIPRNHYFTDLDPEVEAAVRGVGTTFRALGAELREVEVAGAETMHGFAVNIVYADAALRFREQLTQSPSPISEPVRIRMSRGLELTALDYAAAVEARREWRRTLANLFETVDILLVPTSPVPAQPVEDERDLHRATGEATRFTYPSAAAGIPSLSGALRLHGRGPAHRLHAGGGVVARAASAPRRARLPGRHRMAPPAPADTGRRLRRHTRTCWRWPSYFDRLSMRACLPISTLPHPEPVEG